MVFKTVVVKSDSLGVMASGLCLIHCLATPFLFVAKSCAVSCCAAAPIWWVLLDYIFLIVSFFAVYWSTLTTSNKLVKSALWLSWLVLSFILMNEQIQLLSLPTCAIYLPAFALVSLHIYNLKYCRCQETECCTKQEYI